MNLLNLKWQRLGGVGDNSPQRKAMRSEILEMVALLREAMGGGVAGKLASLLKTLSDNGPAIQKGLIAWIRLVEVLVQEAERGQRKGGGPRKNALVKAALFRILNDPRAQLPGIPKYLYPLVMDVGLEWVIDGIVQVEKSYALWDSSPEDNESSRMADSFSWLKQFWEPAIGFLITTYTTFKYRQPLPPELRKAVEGVEVSGLLTDQRRNIHAGVELVQFLGDHGEQAIAGIKLIFEAVYKAESFLELDGPGKKQYAHDLIVATLEELGFPVGSGLIGVIAGVFIDAGIESAVSIFTERAPESFKHRRTSGGATGSLGAPGNP